MGQIHLGEFHLDANGVVREARWVPSPNFDARPASEDVSLVIVHGISLPPGVFGGAQIEDFFCNRLAQDQHPFFQEIARMRVSAHFLIRRDGELVQFVSCSHRAWHAGDSQWGGRARCNDFSIGVELEGADSIDYEQVQYRQLASLVRSLKSRYPLDEVVGHCDVAPSRKTDPGPAFDWSLLRVLMSPDFPGKHSRRG